MPPLEGQVHADSAWDSAGKSDRLEYGLMAGYLVIAFAAVITGAKDKIAEGLILAVPQTIPAAHAIPKLTDLMGTSMDLIAAGALLIISGVVLYRRRRDRTNSAKERIGQRLDLPFLF